jgi:hypothetical protein
MNQVRRKLMIAKTAFTRNWSRFLIIFLSKKVKGKGKAFPL